MRRVILPRAWPPVVFVGADPPAPNAPATPPAPKPLPDAVLLALKNMQTEATSSYQLYMAQRTDREAEFNKKLEYLDLIPVYGQFIKAGVKTFLVLGNILYPPPDETEAVNAYLAAAETAVPLGIIAPPLDLEVTAAATSLAKLNEVIAAFRNLPGVDEEAVLAVGAALMKFRTDPKATFFVEALKVPLYGMQCFGGLYGDPRAGFDTYSEKEQANLLRRPVAIAMLAALAADVPLGPVQEAAVNAFLADSDNWARTVNQPETTDQRGNVHPAKSYVTSCPYGQSYTEFAAIHAKIAKAALAAADKAKPKINLNAIRFVLAGQSTPLSTPAKVGIAAGGVGLAVGLWWLLKTKAAAALLV